MFAFQPDRLQHASYVAAVPSSVSVNGVTPETEAFPFTYFQVSDGPVIDSSAYAGATALSLIAAIVASGSVVDEHGKSPLSFSYSGTTLTISSAARLRVSGIGAMLFWGGAIDVNPTPERIYDTTDAHVESGGQPLADRISELSSRVFNALSVIASVRDHGDGPTLVSKGATAGNEIYVEVTRDLSGSSAAFTILPDSTAADFAAWANADPTLNPDGTEELAGIGFVGRNLRVMIHPISGALVLQQMQNRAIAVYGGTASADRRALLGTVA